MKSYLFKFYISNDLFLVFFAIYVIALEYIFLRTIFNNKNYLFYKNIQQLLIYL